MRRKLNTAFGRAALCALVAFGAVACAPPPSTAEGIIDDADFAVHDDAPEVRNHKASDGLMVILAEADTDEQRLRTVSIRLPKAALLEPGVLNVGERDDEAWIELTDGALTTERLSDGVTVVSSELPSMWKAVGGTVALVEVRAVLAGEFVADFGDIGFVTGKFEVPWETERDLATSSERDEDAGDPEKGELLR